MNKYIFLLVVMATLLILAPIIKPSFEGFSLNNAGIYPQANDVPILVDEYPYTGSKTVSKKDASEIWTNYPQFQLGSYEQITNNFKYPNNPDNGTCSRAEFCGALYENKSYGSNIIESLPPVCSGPGARVGYFRSDKDLLPFNNKDNILY
jgi:hypothetical protein